MKADNEVRRDVEAELRWSPDLDEKDISVKASGGVVTLTGYVGNYYEKGQAELATKRVAGVSGVANDIQVRSIYSGVERERISRRSRSGKAARRRAATSPRCGSRGW